MDGHKGSNPPGAVEADDTDGVAAANTAGSEPGSNVQRSAADLAKGEHLALGCVSGLGNGSIEEDTVRELIQLGQNVRAERSGALGSCQWTLSRCLALTFFQTVVGRPSMTTSASSNGEPGVQMILSPARWSVTSHQLLSLHSAKLSFFAGTVAGDPMVIKADGTQKFGGVEMRANVEAVTDFMNPQRLTEGIRVGARGPVNLSQVGLREWPTITHPAVVIFCLCTSLPAVYGDFFHGMAHPAFLTPTTPA
jgi:hypothetical protein